MKMNSELKLYKLCCTNENKHKTILVDELGWVSQTSFFVWVSYVYLGEFVEGLKKIFGYRLFDDASSNAVIKEYCVCIDLYELLGDSVDIETIFSKEKYLH